MTIAFNDAEIKPNSEKIKGNTAGDFLETVTSSVLNRNRLQDVASLSCV